MNDMQWLMIGAGGHAKSIAEAIAARGETLCGYVDMNAASWLSAQRFADDVSARSFLTDSRDIGVVMGMGGADVEALARRLAVLDEYEVGEACLPSFVHPTAQISETASLEKGALVLSGAIVHPNVHLGRGALINTGAIIEHDSHVGAGAHIAPGAIVLGGASIGDGCMIGAGAVILPGHEIAPSTLVPALTRA